jgi:hypothetical protein
MARKKKYDYDHDLDQDPFEHPWCPLFGEIPDVKCSPGSPLRRCLNIIESVRHDFWEVEGGYPAHWANYHFDAHFAASNWPDPKEIPDYPEWKIRAARSICWQDFKHTTQSTRRYYLEKDVELSSDQNRTVFGDEVSDFDIDQKPRTLIFFARKGICFPCDHDDDIYDMEILSMIALAIAWRVVRDILFYHKAEDNSAILKETLLATSLLARSFLKWAEADFKYVLPLADKAEKFGPKEKRQDRLMKEIERTYRGLLLKKAAPTAKQVLRALPSGADQVVQEIIDDNIEWTDRLGREKNTSFHDFEKRLSRIRKKISSK